MFGAPVIFPRGREIILGVGAGIAAYKSCDLLRRLQDQGFLLTVIPTDAALNFVGKATWQALSGRPVATTVWEDSAVVSHVSLAEKADLILIAPATADLIARLANGRADDLLTTTVIASQAPIILVPAMHPNMWLNPATVSNVEILRGRGYLVIEPEFGRLTGKDSGIGRFPDSETIIKEVMRVTKSSDLLVGKKVLVTTGGTREAIDPVRFIGNNSSGKQGLAVAYEAIRAGAEVTLIAANTDYFELEGATILKVESADEMKDAVLSEIEFHDALVMAAAVADVKPLTQGGEKIKKQDLNQIQLEVNPDILKLCGEIKKDNQVLVGFAAETSGEYESLGKEKLIRKGADILYVNNVSNGAIFGSDLTSGSLLSRNESVQRFEGVTKYEVGKSIVKEIAQHLERLNA
jgi:phosphopantothenoylcysteine decarboxylase/phosphopantothenate--cysteine ligase